MVVKLMAQFVELENGLRVVLSHMVVKQHRSRSREPPSLRVVLSHMVVKL